MKDSENRLEQIISPNREDVGSWIHQDAWFHIGTLDTNLSTDYRLKKPGNGVYIFIISGSIEVENIPLETRDGLGIYDIESIHMRALSKTRILVMEVPMR